MTRRRSRLTAAALLATTGALVLAGCAIPLPQVEAEPAPEGPQPALDEPRTDRVLDAVAEAIAAADEAQDSELLEPRVNGPALQTRDAEYRLAEATADAENPTTPQQLTTEPQVVVMGNAQEWPKTVMVFTTIADGMNTPLLIGLEQDEPRDPYHMFAWVRLLPEVTTPETAVTAEGSPAVAPDAEGLLLSPEETVSGYADLLQEGEDSDVADSFAEDPFRTLVAENNEAIEAGVEDAGTYAETFRMRDWAPVSLETVDGGAIVIGAMRSDQTYELTEEGGSLTVSSPDVVALEGGEDSIDVESSLTATYYLTVAFYVPPESAEDGTIQVLGAERALDEVTTD
jgi:hypothetical protein